jgi:PEP-CTERM motif-containing protein
MRTIAERSTAIIHIIWAITTQRCPTIISYITRGSTDETPAQIVAWFVTRLIFVLSESPGHVELTTYPHKCMKAQLITVAVGLIFNFTMAPVLAQSTFIFVNYAPGADIDAPVFDAAGNRLSGTNYLAILYGGPSPESLQPASTGNPVMSPVPFTYTPNGQEGYFGSGGFVIVNNVDCGAYAWLQVRAWDARLGATYDEVARLGLGGYGESALFYTYGGEIACSPTGRNSQALRGLESFSLRPIPEPGPWALLAFGAGFLCWRWRRKT